MKKFYVTKKQVIAFIEKETKKLGYTQLVKEVDIVLRDLMDFPNENKAQIKFYSRVAKQLN